MDMINELDEYVTFLKGKIKDLTFQLTKTIHQSYLCLILNSSEHSLEVFLGL